MKFGPAPLKLFNTDDKAEPFGIHYNNLQQNSASCWMLQDRSNLNQLAWISKCIVQIQMCQCRQKLGYTCWPLS